ncbi:hypothetical protein TNIN_90011 [Trichonephila inaurata madagascariensis]|uniref:Uncharacterized protein n=1 Tax=Trichonephila inaurata madagascariensis TaxID=2747483 RepID=A0A8X6XEL3_9ARAC|nr:hypothetical protein TNIN_90011 [Trichonephila inaurata madagascariensis]
MQKPQPSEIDKLYIKRQIKHPSSSHVTYPYLCPPEDINFSSGTKVRRRTCVLYTFLPPSYINQVAAQREKDNGISEHQTGRSPRSKHKSTLNFSLFFIWIWDAEKWKLDFTATKRQSVINLA